MKTAFPVVLAVLFSYSELASGKQPDINLHLQERIQAAAQSIIETRLAQRLQQPPAIAAPVGSQRLVSRITAAR